MLSVEKSTVIQIVGTQFTSCWLQDSSLKFSLTLTHLFFSYKEIYDYIKPIHIIQDNLKILNLLTSTKCFLPCKITHLQVPGVRIWTSLGERLFHLPHFPPHFMRQETPWSQNQGGKCTIKISLMDKWKIFNKLLANCIPNILKMQYAITK